MASRSQVAFDKLAEQGYRMHWMVDGPGAAIRCFVNGSKVVLLATYAQNNGWELFRPLDSTNSVADTFKALDEYTKDAVSA